MFAPFAFVLLLLPLTQDAQPPQELPVIPQPNRVEMTRGDWTPSPGLAVRFDQRLEAEARWLAAQLKERLGHEIPLTRQELRIAHPQEIHLQLIEEGLSEEAYRLQVGERRVDLKACGAAGIYYGLQTLLQAWPATADGSIPCCLIEDAPRFAWRGLHLDVGRHFFAKDDIKKLIDWMGVHKLNTFHWHLTEDQGWRLEIKAFPKLTSVGAFRASSPPYGNRKGSDGKRYGGFYTQEDVREIVAYARERHIVVVPEIDMPGHMAAAIAAYPELGNTDIPDYQPSVQTHWGVKPYTLAPKEETFEFVDKVLGEVCELFPSAYIHIGGDEAPKGQWAQSPFAQKVMVREELKDENELQAYFLARVSKMLEKRGRKMLGWDEIREGGLVKGATVMNWRGWNHSVEAAQAGHDVVMANTSHTYLDYYQADPKSELAKGDWYECIGGHLELEKVYSFEPISAELKGTPAAKHILGCQAQLWTEYVKTWEKLEYLAFPRVSALAEVAWTQPERKDYGSFSTRLRPMLERLKAAGVRYYDPFEGR